VRHVREVLQLLCSWGGSRLKFLGHIMESGMVAIPEDRAKAIYDYVPPSTKRGLHAFLEVVSY